MPDFGAILRKAREGAGVAGAAGATGAGSKFPLQNKTGEAAQPGPGSFTHAGPPGPRNGPGPGGPSPASQPGPALLQNWRELEQRLIESGPAGPGGPSEKQHVGENSILPAARAWLSDAPQGWRDGLSSLDIGGPPCPGFRSGEWECLHRVIADFMDRYAAEAFALAWTALDLFGVHRAAGAADVSSCGALMLPWRRTATSLTAHAIAFGPLVYRRRLMPEAVLVWDFTEKVPSAGWQKEGMGR